MIALASDLVYRTCLALDARDFDRYLALCTLDFRYTVKAYAPEIRRDMVWLDHDRAGMEALFRTLPRHQSDPSPLTRHASVYTVDLDRTRTKAAVVTSLLVFRTALDGGATSLFAVGKLHDEVTIAGGTALLARRTVALDTRELGIGTHVPL